MHSVVKFLFDEIEKQNTNIFSISHSLSISPTAIYDWRRCHRTPRIDYLDEALKTLGYQLTVTKVKE